MTQHITQEQAAKLLDAAETAATEYLGDEGEFHPDHHEVEAMFICNAAIQQYIDSIDTSLERVEKYAGNGWMPIETAPTKPFEKKDWFIPHSENLLLLQGRNIVIGSYGFTEKGKGRWRGWNGTIYPTHWMPLPPAPKE